MKSQWILESSGDVTAVIDLWDQNFSLNPRLVPVERNLPGITEILRNQAIISQILKLPLWISR